MLDKLLATPFGIWWFLFSLDVGRSCILVTMGGKNIMLDCGMHMGFNDEVVNYSVWKLRRLSVIYVIAYVINFLAEIPRFYLRV